jgi:CsoR family transcriptional regulator, copper-sensing transcriptional repressor
MVGYSGEKDQHLNRLRRIEGQLRGLQRMVEEDQYCIDILTQVSAATKALQSFSLELLEQHLKGCVREAVASGGVDAGGDRPAGQVLSQPPRSVPSQFRIQ